MGLDSIKNKKIRTLFCFTFIFCAAIVLSVSCQNDGNDVSGTCLSCNPERPDTALISVKITLNSENPYVILTIYKDKFDPKRTDTASYIELTDTARESPYIHRVPVDRFYSVKVRYKSGLNVIYAVDGGIFQAQQQSGCENTCWQTVGGHLDARLNFKK